MAPGVAARDNANQITMADGTAPITNMYLWQPLAAAFYAPCVDGDYDMSVIAHEYTHAISNRMAGGPNANLSGSQAGAMGESWSDLAAIEYLNGNGFAPIADENRFAVGAYVTGDKQAGIRNYGMNVSPLNYSDVGYDFACNDANCTALTQVHADGEIWSATNFDVRQAFIARYGAGSAALQAACARGDQPVTACPGNRRWVQLMFDAWLLMPSGAVSMVDARNALLAADQLRFSGINQDILWNAFAHRGLGQAASSNTTNDADPVPAFDSPFANEATLRFRPTGDAAGQPAQLFVGKYEARATPIADTDPSTALDDTFPLTAGTYEFVARANGFGATRLTATVRAGQLRDLTVNMRENLASGANGATATGRRRPTSRALIDDTEATQLGVAGVADRRQAGDRAARPVGPRAHDPARPGQRAAAPPAARGSGRRHAVAEPLLGAAAVRDPRVRGPRRGRLQPGRAVPVDPHERGRTRSRPVCRARGRRS